jgi:hypothetical protein
LLGRIASPALRSVYVGPLRHVNGEDRCVF